MLLVYVHIFIIVVILLLYNIPYKQKYWQALYLAVAQKCCLRDFKLVVLSTICMKTHACSINGSIMAEVNLAIFTQSPNRHIKITANISAYMVLL